MTETTGIPDDIKLRDACQKAADAFGLPVEEVLRQVSLEEFSLQGDTEWLKRAVEARRRRVASQRRNPPMPAENLGPETRQVRRARERALDKSLHIRKYRGAAK